ncbi:HAMP domain-containing histidine kinase [Ruminococcaceae bacterium OttesenSCG-928-L11]|nr:HAMP domain-containing histidine kinase [Ruminococcaceae bacterium OttesenSCG-928-L11]
MTKRDTILPVAITVILMGMLSLWHLTSMGQAEAMFTDRAAAILAMLPEQEDAVISALKEPDETLVQHGYELLSQYGYPQGKSVLLRGRDYRSGLLLAAAFSLCAGLAVMLFSHRQRLRQRERIVSLTEYLGQVNSGNYRLRPEAREDLLSPLEDELYKTIVLLREGREQATAARQSLADNLADIAHQLKTPLSSIMLLADMQGANQISAQAEKMSGLVSSLLALSRIDAGTLVMEQKQVDVGELCQCAADAVSPLFAASGIQLRLPETDATYTGDLEWSIQALANILKNCYEHTPGGGEITVSCEENPLFTAICIEDNGPGIPAEDLPCLFERFYRGKQAKKDSVGIGLSLSKALVEAQNGTLTAENRAEGGARFLLKFFHAG